jgi:hypothetical protein
MNESPREPEEARGLTAIPPRTACKSWATRGAIHLLAFSTNSPVLHTLGPPWRADRESVIPLLYPGLSYPRYYTLNFLSLD